MRGENESFLPFRAFKIKKRRKYRIWKKKVNFSFFTGQKKNLLVQYYYKIFRKGKDGRDIMKKKWLTALGLTFVLSLSGMMTSYAMDNSAENVAESFVEEKNAETESAAAIQQENEHEADVTDSEKSTEDVIDPEESSENSGITEEKNGWVEESDGIHYYQEGKDLRNAGYSLDGYWYYFVSSGEMAKGWKYINGNYYYLANDGVMRTGWQDIDGYRYYFYKENEAGGWGVMAHDTTINGIAIDSSGHAKVYSTRMAVFSTVSTNNANGTYNMTKALLSFNQVVLQPGQTLSFFAVAGPCGKAQGYKEAGVVGGTGYGGGICQASTTLYGAAIRAGMTIVQRRNHSVPSTYVPIGQDAMVDYGSSDLKFRNDFNFPVKIVTYVSGKTLYAEIWGLQPTWYDYINVSSWSTGAKSAAACRYYIKNGSVVKTEQLPSSYYK